MDTLIDGKSWNAALDAAISVILKRTAMPEDALARGTGIRDQTVLLGEALIERLITMKMARDITLPDGSVRHNVGSDNLSDEDRAAMELELERHYWGLND